MSSLLQVDRLGAVTEDLTTTLELPAGARTVDRARRAYRKGMYEVRHPENHKQAVRFLCVGASGYVINLASFTICLHMLGLSSPVSFVTAFLIGSTNNFFWNRHWTFKAHEQHPGRQAMRFFLVSLLVFFFATGVYYLLNHTIRMDGTVDDGLAWAIATPLSFVVQKLWSFKA
jgi:putative flippase GtrA